MSVNSDPYPREREGERERERERIRKTMVKLLQKKTHSKHAAYYAISSLFGVHI